MRGSPVNAGAWYMGSAIDDSRFAVYAVPAASVSLDALEQAIDAALVSAVDGLDATAIERAKTRLIAETIYSLDSQSSLARIYGSALAVGETIEDVREWPELIQSVTREDIVTAIRTSLTARRSVTGQLVKASA